MAQLSFKGALVNGLRPRSKVPVNSELFETYSYLRCSERGAVPQDLITQPISSAELTAHSVTVSHPFPQFFKGKEITLCCDSTNVFVVDSGWDLDTLATHWSNASSYYNLYSTGDADTIPNVGGTPWQFADFGDTWILFNGECQLIHSRWLSATKAFVQDSVTMVAGCHHKHNGRLIVGGFDSSDYWTKWGTEWSDWVGKASDWGFSRGSPDTNWVWWSSVGGGDLLFFFLPDLAKYGLENTTLRGVEDAYDPDSPFWRFFWLRNSQGMMPMPFQGTVWNLRPMGQVVMVYGSEGVAALVTASDPYPTYGLAGVMNSLGIMSRNAVSGDESKQVFVDAEGVLWMVGADLQLSRLGYKEYLSALTGEVTVSHDPHEDRFYISGSNASYMLTQHGLCRHKQKVSSLVRDEDNSSYLLGSADSPADPGATLLTEVFSFGRNVTALKEVQVVGVATQAVSVTPKYRFDTTDSFSSGTAATLDGRGKAHLTTSGMEFQLQLTNATSTSLEVHDIIVTSYEGERLSLKEMLSA